MKLRLSAVLFAFLHLASLQATLRADEPKVDLSRPEFANCSWYRSKKADVPVYKEPDSTAQIEGRLNRGEKACYIGEQLGFAIIQWGLQPALRGGTPEKEEHRGYVRLVDLWPPRNEPEPINDKVKDAYKFRQAGGVNEDPLWMLRPFLDIFYSQDPCSDPTVIGCPAYQPKR